MSFEERKTNWSRYSTSEETNSLLSGNETNIKDLLKRSYQEKDLKNIVRNTGKFLVFGFCYYTWNIWRWFTPQFYNKLFVLFVQSQTDQEETNLKGWFSYILRNLPRSFQQRTKELSTQIIENWTIETTFRITLFPLAIILGCFQSSYERYSFLFPNQSTSYQSISWKDFKTKELFFSLQNKEFKLYDKFILVNAPQGQKNYRIILPPTTSNKELIVAIRKMMRSSLKNQPVKKASLVSSLVQKQKIFSKNKDQYKKNYFRHLRTRALSVKTQAPDIYFHNDPKDFFPGYLSNLGCFVRIYAALFPLWVITTTWDRINFIKADARTTKAKTVKKSQNKKRFKDLAGIEKLLPDLQELVQALNVKLTRTKLPSYAPKGYILVGPPGTGKTLLAQAIAGESQVTFFFTSGSEFIESQNGIGPARLRDLFTKAKKELPAIIFIDEIDTLGKAREGSVNSLGEVKDISQTEEKIQILTEFLVQMDGFSERSNLVIIGATNFLELLDPAFIRPGRFDRIFQLELPSKAVRIEILKLHASRKGFESTVPWDYFGKCTIGFSGADLSAIVNESFLKLIREKKKFHTLETLQHGFNRISTYSKDQAKELEQNSLGKVRQAYYQAGIGLLHLLLPELPNKLSLELVSRPKNLRYLRLEKQIKSNKYEISNQKFLRAKLLGHLSGVATEFYILKELGSMQNKYDDFWLTQQGAADLEKATKLINTMINDYGLYNDSIFLVNSSSRQINSTTKRFDSSEIYSYDQVWDFFSENFMSSLNEEEDKEKPMRMNWRFFSFWIWQLTSQLYYSKTLPKWGKSYIDEKTQENQESLIPDDYFHKNQLVQPVVSYEQKRDFIIQDKLKSAWEEIHEIINDNRELLDALANALLTKEKLIEQEIIEIGSKYKTLPVKVVE